MNQHSPADRAAFSAYLKAELEARGWSIAELARRSGLCYCTCWGHVHELSYPYPLTMDRYRKIFRKKTSKPIDKSIQV